MPVEKGKKSGHSTTSVAASIVLLLIVIVGLSAMVFGVNDDLFDDSLDTLDKLGKIAVASDGKKLNSYVSPVFGQARYFLIVEPSTGKYKAIRNPFRTLDGAAGIRVAQLIAKEADEGVITGDIGPEAYNVLDQMGLDVYTGFMGTSKEAIDDFKKHKIAEAQGATVSRGFGRPQVSSSVDYYHCPNCNTVVPCQPGINGAGGACPACPSCGMTMQFGSNRPQVAPGMGIAQGYGPGMGQGRGRLGSNLSVVGGFGQGGVGINGYLTCPNCGDTVPHQRGVPVYNVTCPTCGTLMCRQNPALIPTAFTTPTTRNYSVQNTQVATQGVAPPITSNAVMIHQYRGVCSKCHQITNVNGQPVANRTYTGAYNGAYNGGSRVGPGGSFVR